MGDAKALTMMPREQFEWQEIGNGYQIAGIGSNHGGLRQRWLLVYSEQAAKRETETFNKSLEKIDEKLKKDVWHLENQLFTEESCADKACHEFSKKLRCHHAEYTVTAVFKHTQRGRPKAGQQAADIRICGKGGMVTS
ncbi:MAG: hypothetical protein HQL60_00405 [Magnetococcales bacterium]|nr:hypothetical protein [Magnetococcales bacterium]